VVTVPDGIPLWPESAVEAKKVQRHLEKRIRIIPLKKTPRYVAAADAAFTGDRVIGAACLFRYPELAQIEEAVAVKETGFPYIPGYLSFREGPAIMAAIGKLGIRPDLILFDGQGIAHPGGIGLASHMGVLLDTPSIGCAKSRLVGEFREPGKKKGRRSRLTYNKRTVGAVLRTRDGVRPVFVSPGHRIDLEAAIGIVLKCTTRYRIPDPLRCADTAAARAKKESR
jgi:deoxyribonuclease V